MQVMVLAEGLVEGVGGWEEEGEEHQVGGEEGVEGAEVGDAAEVFMIAEEVGEACEGFIEVCEGIWRERAIGGVGALLLPHEQRLHRKTIWGRVEWCQDVLEYFWARPYSRYPQRPHKFLETCEYFCK